MKYTISIFLFIILQQCVFAKEHTDLYLIPDNFQTEILDSTQYDLMPRINYSSISFDDAGDSLIAATISGEILVKSIIQDG